MADYRAIEGASKTLRNLLRDRMQETIPVTLAPPDVKITGVNDRRLCLYLYQVTENSILKNQEIPGQGHPGAYGRPPLSLDLHYLVTAYGGTETTEDADLHAQRILGDAMRVLHDYAIITSALHQDDDPHLPTILDETLVNEFEPLKITLQPVTLEDLSKIWTALPEANFRRSLIYLVSVVQIESRLTRRLALPVKSRRLHLLMGARPEIASVYRTPGPLEPPGDGRLKLGQELTIKGKNFQADKTWVRLGGLEPIRVTPADPETLRIVIPDHQYPVDADHPLVRPIPAEQRLLPGPVIVEVQTERPTEVVEGGLERGATIAGARVHRSNQAVFMLAPEITAIVPMSGAGSIILAVHGRRLYHPRLKSLVLVGDAGIEVRPPDPLHPLWAPPTETQVQVPLDVLARALPTPPAAGQDYPVRMLVNGAQSMEETIFFKLMP